jgi:hypothetical protein
MKLKLGIFAPILAGVRKASRAAFCIGKERRWSCAPMSAYFIVLGRTMFGLASLTRHGKAKLEGNKIDRGNARNASCGRKENNIGSEYLDRKCRGRMQN